jgi:hypothetical protein
MGTQNGAEEACVLQDLLADSHTRIRELEARVDWLANELLTLMLNDRRRPATPHNKISRERRRSVVHPIERDRTKAGLRA